MTTGILPRCGIGDRRRQRDLVERRQHDAGHAAADEPFDLGDLRVAIVLPQRTAPDDVDAELLAGAVRRRRECSARTRARALRDDGDRAVADERLRLLAAAAARHREHAGMLPLSIASSQSTPHTDRFQKRRALPPSTASRSPAGLALERRDHDSHTSRVGAATVHTGQSDPIISRSAPNASNAASRYGRS